MKNSKSKSINEITDLEKRNPKEFWKWLKRLISPSEDHTMLINPENWVDHFKKILQTPPPGDDGQSVFVIC